MSRELLNVNNTDTIKQNDDSTTIILSAHDDNEPRIFKAGDVGTIHISTSQYHIPSVPAKLIAGSNNVNINSADLVSLPAGKYSLELWVSQKDGPRTTIYPSSGSFALTIDKNADDLTDKTLTTLTLDDLRKDLHADVADAVKHIKVDPSMLDLSDYAKKADVPTVTLDIDKRTITINKQTINIPNSVDLSSYAKTSDVPNVKYNSQTKTLTVDGMTVEIPSTVDLSDYYTKEQVEQQIKNNKVTVDLTDYVKTEQLSDLAKKTDVPAVALDTEKRTITVNGTAINIPDSVDLSGYATKSELPKVTLDVAKRKITVGDASINVPDNVDLSNYYTKSQIDDKLATASAGGKVDLSGYVKTEQLNDYAKKTDVPNVVYDQSKKTLTINGVNVDLPDNVDLSDYVRKEDTSNFAKKTDIPTVPMIALDTAKRTLTVNGNVINIPDNVDLTGYVKTGDLADYALKSDIPASPDLSEYAKKTDIKTVDLTPYIKAVDADAKYATKSEIPDLSGYAKKSDIKPVDLTPYVKTVDADAKYATKAEIPDLSGYAKKTDIKAVDLTPYVKTVDADAKYATKDDVAAVEKQPGTPGKDGYSVWSADGVQGGMGQRGVNVSDLNPSSYSSRAKIGDLVIDTKLGAIYSIVAISDGYATFSQNYGNLVGPQGEQGHGLWYSTVNAVSTSVPVSDIAGYDQYSNVLPKTNDVVIDSEGNVVTISYLAYDYTQTPYRVTAVNTGSSLGKLSAGSSDIQFSVSSDSTGNVNIAFNNQEYTLPIHTDKPDDYNNGHTNTRQFIVVANNDLKKYLHILDDTTQYTLDVDTGKVNNYGIVPGVYPLRDNGISNLKITSGSNYEGLKDKPTYIIQYIQDVEYAKIMYLTTDFTVHYAVRPIWSADNYIEYYGSHYSWHEI